MTTLLDEDFLRKLERLTLISRKVRAGSVKGERRSTKRGTSVQFADYRNYYHGDDLRQVDWNIYARLEKVFLKLFEEEEELTVHIIVDASPSMNWNPQGEDMYSGAPPADYPFNKLTYARRTAAAIGYVALAAMDMVTVGALDADQAALSTANAGIIGGRLPLLRGKNQALRLLRFVNAIAPARAGAIIEDDGNISTRGSLDLNMALSRYAQQARTPGLLVLISDLLDPAGAFDGLRALQGAGHEVVVIHTLSPDEVKPEVRGDFRLVDSESGVAQEISVDSTALARYHKEFERWTGEVQAFCLRRGISYVLVETSQPFEDLVLHYLRQRGIVA